jgi:hypothetical protein
MPHITPRDRHILRLCAAALVFLALGMVLSEIIWPEVTR